MENYQLNPLLTENVSRRLFRMDKAGTLPRELRSFDFQSGELAQNLVRAKQAGKDFAKVAKKSKLADAAAKRANNMAQIVFKKTGDVSPAYERAVETASKKAAELRKPLEAGKQFKRQAKLITRDSSGVADPIHDIINRRARGNKPF